MADRFETPTEQFTIERLRTVDSAYLRGASRSASIPDPIAIATGPDQITGPINGATGANEYWGIGVFVPAAPDLVWVCVSTSYLVQKKTTADPPPISVLVVDGNISDTDELIPPMYTHGYENQQMLMGAGGVYRNLLVPTDNYQQQAIWVPMDPTLTENGWYVQAVLRGPAAGLAQNDCMFNLSGVRFLGFPVNVWGTGPLWSLAASRGS